MNEQHHPVFSETFVHSLIKSEKDIFIFIVMEDNLFYMREATHSDTGFGHDI